MRNDNYDLAAILEDLRAGEPYKAIATRRGVSRQLVSRIAINHDLRRRKEYIKRPVRLCGCGTKTTATNGVCVLCRETSGYPVPSPTDGIDPKGWVLDRRRRILVWQEAS